MRTTKDLKLKSSGGVLDIFDNQIKGAFNLTDEEYDYLCEHMTDEECHVMVAMEPTFAERRQMIEIRNRYLEAFSKSLD